ncbi:MAG: hypothetical protein ACK4VI_04745 [Alphaproteobacteria bacterium]
MIEARQKYNNKKKGLIALVLLVVFFAFGAVESKAANTVPRPEPGPSVADAGCCIPFFGICPPCCLIRTRNCSCGDTAAAEQNVRAHHVRGETNMMNHMRESFHRHREWIVRRPFMIDMIVTALMLMAEQMSNVGMFQVYIVGKFFDAKLHLETQRLFNELQNEAARDYHPSESFCYFGTNVRSMAHSEMRSRFTQGVLNKAVLDRGLGNANNSAAYASVDEDMRARWEQFRTTYCTMQDNSWSGAQSGLVGVCNAGLASPTRLNIDVDYQRLVDSRRHINIDYRNRGATIDEADIMALSKNLYGHKTTSKATGYFAARSSHQGFLELRSVIAKRSVAQNTFNAIVGLKSSGTGEGESPSFFRAIMSDMGLNATEITEIYGLNPSYYGQLEAMSKKIFQNTDFFTDLYDTPANVKRKQAALNAIELMLDRAIYESELRHEMLLSVLLSSYLESEKDLHYTQFGLAGKR